MEKRAAATDALLTTPVPTTSVSVDAICDAFADGHRKEMKFIGGKLQKHTIEAYLQGHLPEGRVDENVADQAEAFREKLRQAQRERNNRTRVVQRRTLQKQDRSPEKKTYKSKVAALRYLLTSRVCRKRGGPNFQCSCIPPSWTLASVSQRTRA